jgi:uncharacterized protein YkwD
MFADVNATRARAGLPALVDDSRLDKIAVEHAMDMAENGYFGHASRTGQSPFDRMATAHIPFTYAGENVAEAPDEAMAYQGLLGSPTHLRNILQSHFSRVGIAAVDGPGGEMFFVQDFTN